ncbi:glycoprotein 3-alpha-L-fucosyltransferase A [Caerostris extrusa]|uniref:Fucosyltransferase n=1 Tax=Caerostris extrusa TaxID=172846 RepID=A0AAV4NY85_CAEEX|nr:glycoprotein 3-alpha-L-fucosyltransferase A [Caerostris extrusa]
MPLRVLHKHAWLLLPLPIVTFVFIFLYSSLDEVVLVNNTGQIIQKTASLGRSFADLTGEKSVQRPTVPNSDSDDRFQAFRKSTAVGKNIARFAEEGPLLIFPRPFFIYKKVDNSTHNKRLHVTQKQAKKNFTIHVWRHGERMKRRFLRSYGSSYKDPYATCSVNNCQLSTNDSLVYDSDAVLFHLHQTKGPKSLPPYHPKNQLWIFFTDESPHHTFLTTRRYTMKDYNGIFNWSMTYRSDSDIPVPYGRTVPLTKEEKARMKVKDYSALKQRGIAILGSNCGGQNYRWDYVKELQKYITVDVYGGCGTHSCPGHFTKDCPLIGDYKFYLAFENSNCKEYITEKLWWNAYGKETVPVVMGAPKSDYEKLCPPDSFIHADDFQSPSELAKYLDFLMNNDTAYNSFFDWKKQYKVVNEHGYFGSPSLHLCRICEALNNYNYKPKTYSDLKSFWNVKTDCKKPSWTPED